MLQNKKYCHTQSGNVFVLILIGVFLFGALMFTFSRSGEQGSGKLTKQQTKIAAQEIINYGRSLEDAVNRVRRKGCSESQISFDDTGLTGYENNDAPDDNSCHLFQSTGGKVSYVAPKTEWLDTNHNSESLSGDLYFPSQSCVTDVGTGSACNSDGLDNEDLMIIFPFITQEICEEINAQLYQDRDIPQDANKAWPDSIPKFVGNFSDGNGISDSGVDAKLPTRHFYCMEGGGTPPIGSYHYYHVLLAR